MPRNLAHKIDDGSEGRQPQAAEGRKLSKPRATPATQRVQQAKPSKIGFDRSCDVKITEVPAKHKPNRGRHQKIDKPIESQLQRQSFAKNFREARKDAKLSQRDIQTRTGIPQSHISEIESAMHNICIETMVKLANLVHVPIHELLKP